MHIKQFYIKNFRQLINVKICLSDKRTIFVGANNSGKTSAMQALYKFLTSQGASGGKDDGKRFSVTDISLCNWERINQIGKNWESPQEELMLYENDWKALLPSLDVCLHVEDYEFQYVWHLIPRLDWRGGDIDIRFRFEPRDYKDFYSSFLSERSKTREKILEAKNISEADWEKFSENQENEFGDFDEVKKLVSEAEGKLWPVNMYDFIQRKIKSDTYSGLFTIKAYFIEQHDDTSESQAQEIPIELEEHDGLLSSSPFKGVIRIDAINAQRGFSDVDVSENDTALSSQLHKYYKEILNPDERLAWTDILALIQRGKSENSHSTIMQNQFKGSFSELQLVNIPNHSMPSLNINASINMESILKHSSELKYTFSSSPVIDNSLKLPEQCNGLGYQNLISMAFKLIRFREEWLKELKKEEAKRTKRIEPLHLVLIEEPEAHLHAQVQQVFIREVFKILRRHAALKINVPGELDEDSLVQVLDSLEDSSSLKTQMVLSTHSSYIAHECDFDDLRYFKHVHNNSNQGCHETHVVNLSDTFGDSNMTWKFVKRYLKSTHCDLFFADACIVIEGAAERMLLPFFMQRQCNSQLLQRHISILEINGSHAFRFKDLIRTLGLLTLVITDLDSSTPGIGKACVKKGLQQHTTNTTLRKWIPGIKSIDKLLDATDEEKTEAIKFGSEIHVSYQTSIAIDNKEILTRTFEDALIASNYHIFRDKNRDWKGIDKKNLRSIHKRIINKCPNIDTGDLAQILYDLLKEPSFGKGELALELIFNFDPQDIEVPEYIQSGLHWLASKLELTTNSFSLCNKATQAESDYA